MAVTDMIMTSEREEVVDFTQPFMFDKLAILFVKQSWWETPLTSAEDFLTRNIKLGTYCCGSTFDFLKKSKVAIHQKILQRVLEDPTINTDIENREYYRVAEETGSYASITSAFMARYMSNMNCDLTTIDVDLRDYGYGIALPKGSPYRKPLNLAILRLHETG